MRGAVEGVVTEDQCSYCIASKPSRSVNRVTAGIAIHLLRNDKDEQKKLFRTTAHLFEEEVETPIEIKRPNWTTGTELLNLMPWLKIQLGCRHCEQTINSMNRKGPEWCKKNLRSLKRTFVDESQRRGHHLPAVAVETYILTAITRSELQ